MRSILLFALVTVSACAGRYHTEDVQQAQLDAALTARAQLVYYFVHLGAIEHPPAPADEWAEDFSPGAPVQGGTHVADNATGDVPFSYSDDVITNPPWIEGTSSQSASRRPETHPNTSSWRSPLHPDAEVRDHRRTASSSSSSWSSASHPDADVRDHRSSSSKDDDKSDTKDFGGIRFGHPH